MKNNNNIKDTISFLDKMLLITLIFSSRLIISSGDGSLTMIIVPSAVALTIILLIVVFFFVKRSKRCRSKKRSHDDDIERANNFGPPGTLKNIYMLKTNKRPGTSVVDNGEEKMQVKKRKKKKEKERKLKRNSKRFHEIGSQKRIFKFRKNLSKRIQDKSDDTRVFFRRNIKLVSFPWKRSASNPVEIKKSPDSSNKPQPSLEQRPPSKSSSRHFQVDSSCSCMTREEDFETGSTIRKIPPPRPPSPKLSKKKKMKTGKISTRKTKKKYIKKRMSISSGYSSEEKDKKSKNYRKSSLKVRKKRKHEPKNSQKSKLNSKRNSIAKSENQYKNSENDYRKRGLICNGEIYHPQYHCVKSYPIKPVHKPKKKEDSISIEQVKTLPVGGVKYFPIKQDQAEVKYLTRKTKKSKMLNRKKRSERGVNPGGNRIEKKARDQRTRTGRKERKSKEKYQTEKANRNRRTSTRI